MLADYVAVGVSLYLLFSLRKMAICGIIFIGLHSEIALATCVTSMCIGS